MKFKIALMICLMFTAVAAMAQEPDLTITETLWRRKPHVVQITVANVGQAQAAPSTGSYACQSAPNEKGFSVSFGSLFSVPALAPGQKWKIVLDCQGNKITGAGVDSEKKVKESNEANNQLSFAEVQQQKNKGPIKKTGS